jgi:hypothetical protein
MQIKASARAYLSYGGAMDEADKKFREEHEWKPRMVNGVDCGKWVLSRPFASDR